MDLAEKKIRRQNRDIVLILIPVVFLIAKVIHIYLLPDKYYFDSWRMLSMMSEEGNMIAWTGYQSTVDFYQAINIFGFSTLSQWSIGIGLIMTPITMFMISKTKEMSFREALFTLMAMGLLNIYVFSITKETIQFLFFMAIYIIICLPINSTFIKLLGCAGIFYWESTFYRGYYIIMAAMAVFLYFVFLWLKNRVVIKKKDVIISIVMCYAVLLFMMYMSQYIMPEDYSEAINVRDISVNEDASTAIINPVEVKDNYGNFAIDYVINSIRMMFPIELVFKGVLYIPFFVYQIFILIYFIKTLGSIKKVESNMLVVLSCFSAYLFGSFIFEPDFGSWVRHEAATFPLLQVMAYKCEGYDTANES